MAGSSWTNQVQNTIIVGGANAGVFVYSGTPASGNPPIFWATSATKDPFGNTIPQSSTAGIASPGTFVAGNMIVNTSGIFTYSGTPAANNLVTSVAPAAGTDAFGNQYVAGSASYSFQNVVASFATALNGGTTTWYTAAAGTFGPWTSVATAKTVSVSPTGLTITGAGEAILTNGTASLSVGTSVAPGSLVLSGAVAAINGAVPGSPGVADSWHAMTLVNSWANTAGFTAAQYRAVASPPNSVEIIGVIAATAATSTTFFTLPAAYQPTNAQGFAVGVTANVPAGSSPQLRCSSAGVLTISNAAAPPSAYSVFIHGFISLDA